ncbi:pre-mRNA-splicing factor SPF27 homolog [Rhodamnia argentea]|uniref:Pre-mRNA-splicing factor SPF27 homolog n=1 Tax=Rhodamnia argentea TaxID=178133 RepID=A0A8B8PCV7_9MYRT|nr:pre-mRNA-splicing factor SPF27 homolog [Rhodamnia argentea]
MGRSSDDSISSSSAAAAADNGDILMLEAPPDALARPWTTPSNAETIDALPYIDEDYGHPAVKDEVDRLVEDEMRRSSKKPSDFLKELPPVPKFKFQNNPMLAREYERVMAGRPPVPFDSSRYSFDMVPPHRRDDQNLWKQTVQKNQRLLQYEVVRLENLDLMSKHGADVWTKHNRRLEGFLARLQKLVSEQNEQIETVNRERKYHQQNTAYELNALSTQWRELCQKNIEIQAACVSIENELEELNREAAERGWKLETTMENGPSLH